MKKSVGGQALIEGVMMRCENVKAIAVRKSDGEIIVKKTEPKGFMYGSKLRKIPFLRGLFVLIDSVIEGGKDLTYSANFYLEDEEEETKLDRFLKKLFGEHTEKILNTLMTVVSFALAIGLFVVLPTFLAKNNVDKTSLVSLKEGGIKIGIFVTYLFLMSQIKDIRRVFQYHGAEHKSVYCYEQGKELTVENVKSMSRLHPRCGTNFIFLVLIVSILMFSFVNVRTVWIRSIVKLLLFPLVSGISYELIKLAGKKENLFTKIMVYPGMMLQKITTKEPDESQIEVGIASIKAALGLDGTDKKEYLLSEIGENRPVSLNQTLSEGTGA